MTTCSTCAHWREGGSPLATAAPGRNPLAKPGVGTCEVDTPMLMETKWFPVSMFPEVHADRGCRQWEPIYDGDPGEREDIPADNVVPIDRAAA